MFFWNSLAFSMIQRILAIWSLVLLPFLNPAWTSGSSRFTQGCHRLEQKSVWESMWEHTVSTWTDHVTYGCNSIVLVFDSPNNLFFFFFFLLNFYVWPQGGIWFSLIHKTHLSPFKLESHICLSFWTLGTRIFSNGSISKGYCIPVGFYRSWTKSFLSVSQICIKACLWIFYLLITVLKILHSLGTFPICFFTLRPMVETWIILVCAYYMPHAIVFGNERVQRSLYSEI